MRLKHSSDGDIPIIDISPFFSGHRAKKKEVAKKIGSACETTGFLMISGHAVAQAILEHTFVSTRAFFRLDQPRRTDGVLKDRRDNAVITHWVPAA